MGANLYQKMESTDQKTSDIDKWEASPLSKFATKNYVVSWFDMPQHRDLRDFVYDEAYEHIHKLLYKGKWEHCTYFISEKLARVTLHYEPHMHYQHHHQ